MLLSFATLALLALAVSLGALGALLLRRAGWRIVGAVLLVEALLAVAAQIALSTVPVGIGDPLIRVPFVSLLAQTLGSLAIVAGVAAIVWFGGRKLNALIEQRGRRGIVSAALLVFPLVAAGSMVGLVQASLPERERERDPSKREIIVPKGFTATIYAQGTMDNPTVMAFSPDGKMYIGDISGTLWVATDKDGDHTVDTITKWADGFDLLVGLAWRGDELYAASSGKIEILRDTNGDGVADERRTIVSGLPSMILKPHSNNQIAFGPDGRLYFGVGSTTQGDYEPNELAASLLSVKPDGSDLKVFARGFGNTFGISFNKDGQLFGGDNSPGGGDENPDEFNHIVEGGHYGYPYFYGDPEKNNGTLGALVSFPAHSVPTGMTFYNNKSFPQEYQDNAFTTLWGRGELSRIEVAKTTGGTYLSRASTFASGFLYPVGAITGPDGALYIADFGTTAIYRITYTGTP